MRTRRSAIWTKMPTASWQLLVSSYVPRLRGAATDDPPRTNSIRCITLHTRIVSLPTRSKPTSRLQNRSGPPTAIVDAALARKEWPSTPRRGIKSKRIVLAITQGRIMIPRRSILMAACGCLVLAAAGAHAADPSAKAFVERIYAADKGKRRPRNCARQRRRRAALFRAQARGAHHQRPRGGPRRGGQA